MGAPSSYCLQEIWNGLHGRWGATEGPLHSYPRTDSTSVGRLCRIRRQGIDGTAQLEFFMMVVEEGSFSKAAVRGLPYSTGRKHRHRRARGGDGAPSLTARKNPDAHRCWRTSYDYARRMLALRDQAQNVVSERVWCSVVACALAQTKAPRSISCRI